MTYEQLMNQDMPDSIRELIIDNKIKEYVKKLDTRQKNLEQFLNSFDDFMNSIK